MSSGVARDRRTYPPVTFEFAKKVGLDDIEWERIVDRLGRMPNEYECLIFSALWSEEYANKSTASILDIIARQNPTAFKVAGSRLGLMDIGEGEFLAVRMVDNNHLAFVEPNSGAHTAAAVALDELSGVGARPLGLLNMLRFGQPDHIHTQRLLRDSIDGLSHFSNTSGVPMLGGELYFHPRYNGTMMVNCLALGLFSNNDSLKGDKIPPGSALIYVGAETGPDGLLDDARSRKRREELDALKKEREKRDQQSRQDVSVLKEDRKKTAPTAEDELAKVGTAKTPMLRMSDPYLSLRLNAACAEAIEKGVLTTMVPIGSGGMATAAFDLSQRAGTPVRVVLDRVPVTAEGFSVSDLLLSESCQRIFMVATKKDHRPLTDILYKHGIPNIVVGEFIDSDAVEFLWKHSLVASIPFQFALKGKVLKSFEVVKFPPMLKRIDANAPVSLKPKQVKKKAADEWSLIRSMQGQKDGGGGSSLPSPDNLEDVWLDLLASPNLCSRKLLFRQFDQRLGGRTAMEAGGDAAVVRLFGSGAMERGIAFTLDSNALYVGNDPYLGTIQTVAEGMRNLACVGARPMGISHCLNFGDPKRYREICDLSESVRAIADASREWGIPVVSDSVDLFNGSEANPILPTPVIGTIGVLSDIKKIVPSAFQKAGDKIFLLGATRNEIGCSEYALHIHRDASGLVPDIEFVQEKRVCQAVTAMVGYGLIASAHDLSAGGLAVAFAECCMGRTPPIGATLKLENTLPENEFRRDALLFSESSGRFLVSFPAENEEDLRTVCEHFGVPITGVGQVGAKVMELSGAIEVEVSLQSAYRVWSPGLRHLLGLTHESVLLYDAA